jgi:WD40 repeat protein
LYTLAGHTDWLYPAVFSRDGNKVITASNDGTAKIWNANTGALLYALAEHTPRVKSVEFSRDGKKVVTASRDNTARIWDANTGALLRTLAGHTNGVRSAKFSRDGKRVVTASGDNTAKIWLLPQDNADQALFIQVLQWARRNNKPMMFGAWMHNVFNTYDAATKNNIEKLFGPFRWIQETQTEEQSVGKKRKAEKELGPSNPKQIILEERYEEEDRVTALEYLRKQELKKQKEAMEGFGGS